MKLPSLAPALALREVDDRRAFSARAPRREVDAVAAPDRLHARERARGYGGRQHRDHRQHLCRARTGAALRARPGAALRAGAVRRRVDCLHRDSLLATSDRTNPRGFEWPATTRRQTPSTSLNA
ncbi:MAG: hypothetical protein KC464_19865, partial [Myxococcales bacterium]|nr:hypothetical protein [Myxococcales bacterium]